MLTLTRQPYDWPPIRAVGYLAGHIFTVGGGWVADDRDNDRNCVETCRVCIRDGGKVAFRPARVSAIQPRIQFLFRRPNDAEYLRQQHRHSWFGPTGDSSAEPYGTKVGPCPILRDATVE
jgi:hypothetical protein